MVDPRADGVTAHQPRIVWFQNFGQGGRIRESRIEPQVVLVLIENDWHSVVDGRRDGVGRRGQDRAGLYALASWVLPLLPQPGKREQLIVVDLEAVWLFRLPDFLAE